ncbi:MAG: hypothetical protein RKH07_00840 [Gammaproteobacteria bacterium]
MASFRITATALLATLVASMLVVATANAQSVQRPLRPSASQGIPVIPFMEGWYDNADGSITVSFGYHNRNKENIVVPKGDNNFIVPAAMNGMQPEVYFPGRHHGVFAVTIPMDREDETVWWHLISAGQELKVPGERGSSAYELDRNPRPQGSVQPLIWFDDGQQGSGPEGVVAATTKTTSVGSPIALEVFTEDPSKRDRSDPRFIKPLDTRVSWYKHQGPGEVSFSEHDSTPLVESREGEVLGLIPAPEVAVMVSGGKGPARVMASFSEPGDYLVRARLDNWKSSDSDGLDQCCWSNAYQRIRVTQ